MTKKRERSGPEEAETSLLSAIATRKLARVELQQNTGGQRKNTHEAFSSEPTGRRTAKKLKVQGVPFSSEFLKCVIDKPTWEQILIQRSPFTTFQINDAKVICQNEEELILRIRPRDKLVVLGEFSILVGSGEFSIMGARIRGGPQIHVVSAPLCHSLPIIECLSAEPFGVAEIKIQHYNSGIRSLPRAVPLFKHIWGGDPKTPPDKQLSFTPLSSINNIPQYWKHEVKTLDLSEPWRQLISTLTRISETEPPPVIVVAGPKSGGKSVFCRHLYNSIVTNPMLEAGNGVAFLDLDPGQPEFSPPSQVSLFHLRSPLLGPPFSRTYCGLIDGERLVRSHYIGHSTPENDPDHYVACAVDLFTLYRKLLPACPLVINTIGWVKAIGLEIMSNILRQSFATHLVWLTSERLGAEEVHTLFGESLEGISVHKIPLQPTKHISRTPADLRAMQILSYLHLSSGLNVDAGQDGHGLQWDATPLRQRLPWVVRYSGATPGILGILILEEVLPVELLATAINGTVVAIVVVEDDDALPISDIDQRATDMTNNGKGKQRSRDLAVHHDPATNLPYIPTPNGSPLDPAKTYCAGLALIRGIDTATQTLHLVTPINAHSLPVGKNIVLVRGRTELPVWAYVEGGKKSKMPYLSFEQTTHVSLTVRTRPSGKNGSRVRGAEPR